MYQIDTTMTMTYSERREHILAFLSNRDDWANRATIGNHLGQGGWQNDDTNTILEQLVGEGILETETREIKDNYPRGGLRSNPPTYLVFRICR